MKYVIRNWEVGRGYTKYTLDLTLEEDEVLEKEELFRQLDAPFGAPFGGTVNLLSTGEIEVKIYTD